MKDKTRLLGEEKMSKTLLIMGIPTMIGMLVSALYNMVDAYFVGKLGTLAMAAVSVVYPLSALGMLIGLLFGCGGNSVIARALGKKKYDDVKKYSSTATFSALGLITVIIVILLTFINPLLKLLGSMPSYDDMAREYAIVFIIGLFFNVFNMCMNNMIVAEGNSFISMFAMLVGAVVNIVLDPVLIINAGMGVKGAALATMIARISSAVIYAAYITGDKSMLSINTKYAEFSRYYLEEIIKVGLPVALFQLISGVSSTIVNNLAYNYGAEAQAAIGIVNKVLFLEMNVLYGFFKGYSPVVGYNFGAGKMNRVKEATRLGLIWSTSATALCGVILILFRNQIIYVFNKDSSTVMAIGSFAIMVYAISYLTYGYQIIIGNYFIAIGNARTGGVLSLGKGMLYIAFLFLMEKLFGLTGIILAQICTDVAGTMITAIAYHNNSFALLVNNRRINYN